MSCTMKVAAVLTILFLAGSASASDWVFSANQCSSTVPKLVVSYGGSSKICDTTLLQTDIATPPTVGFSSGAEGTYLLLVTDLDEDDNVYVMSTDIVKKANFNNDLQLNQAVLGYQQPPSPAGIHYQQFRLYKWNSSKRPKITITPEADFNVKQFEIDNDNAIIKREALFQLKINYQ